MVVVTISLTPEGTMPEFKHMDSFEMIGDAKFDRVWRPGTTPIPDGIYECVICGYEITHVSGDVLPDHLHSVEEGATEWRLVAAPRRMWAPPVAGVPPCLGLHK